MDETRMDEAMRALAAADLGSLSEPDRYAFLVNAYNVAALVVARRLLWSQGRSLRSPWTWVRFFVFSRVRVAGRNINLLWLELGLLRRHLKRDPRGHFALVCASSGCPPLRDGAYHGASLDAELEAAGKAFLRPGVGYRLDRQAHTLRMNRIFKWYRRDFRRMGGPREAVLRYGSPEDAEWLRENRADVRFLPYDWRLNGDQEERPDPPGKGDREPLRAPGSRGGGSDSLHETKG